VVLAQELGYLIPSLPLSPCGPLSYSPPLSTQLPYSYPSNSPKVGAYHLDMTYNQYMKTIFVNKILMMHSPPPPLEDVDSEGLQPSTSASD
jgi:hypothetical protein